MRGSSVEFDGSNEISEFDRRYAQDCDPDGLISVLCINNDEKAEPSEGCAHATPNGLIQARRRAFVGPRREQRRDILKSLDTSFLTQLSVFIYRLLPLTRLSPWDDDRLTQDRDDSNLEQRSPRKRPRHLQHPDNKTDAGGNAQLMTA